jgi:hypothetical protein
MVVLKGLVHPNLPEYYQYTCSPEKMQVKNTRILPFSEGSKTTSNSAKSA